jgi:hypothetical protein
MERYENIYVAGQDSVSPSKPEKETRMGKSRDKRSSKVFSLPLITSLVRRHLEESAIEALKGLSGITPGDFKAVIDWFAFRNNKDITHETLVSALADEARLKALHAGQTRIGFLP